MAKYTNVNDEEIRKFNRVADIWWNPRGEMGTLHTINPLRMQFILQYLDVSEPRILDVGCGGGILSEALAKAGAQVLGIDMSLPSLETARRHAEDQGLVIDYRLASLEEITGSMTGSFDAVTCMEMLEHVPEPGRIVADCAQVLKAGGHFFCSTLNRTPKAWLFGIVAGEYILRLLPRGSHTYKQLIRPQEIEKWAGESGLHFAGLASLMYQPLTGKFHIASGKADVNYMMHFIKPA